MPCRHRASVDDLQYVEILQCTANLDTPETHDMTNQSDLFLSKFRTIPNLC